MLQRLFRYVGTYQTYSTTSYEFKRIQPPNVKSMHTHSPTHFSTNVAAPSTRKSCRDCVFYKPRDGVDENEHYFLARCKMFPGSNCSTGYDGTRYEYADICRQHETKCGENAKYFAERKIRNIE